MDGFDFLVTLYYYGFESTDYKKLKYICVSQSSNAAFFRSVDFWAIPVLDCSYKCIENVKPINPEIDFWRLTFEIIQLKKL